MPTNLRSAAVARWVGRGNGPSRVTGAYACPAAGDCYKNDYPYRTLGAARINTALRKSYITQRMARRRISCISSGFTARRTVKGATGCGSLQFPMHSGAHMVRRAPARDRMSPLWQIMAHRHFGHCTAGRIRRARRSLTADDSQRGPSGDRTMHRLLLGHITNFRRGSVARRKRCIFDIGRSVTFFLLSGLPPKENWQKKLANSGELQKDGFHTGREGAGKGTEQGYERITTEPVTRSLHVKSSNHLESLTSGKGRRFLRTRHAWEGHECGCDHDRSLIHYPQQRGLPGIGIYTSACKVYEEDSGWYLLAYRHKSRHYTQRIRHRSRGTVRTTFRHSVALHVSPPVNRGYKPGNRREGWRSRSTSTYAGASDQYWTTSNYPRAQLRGQRIRTWSRGTVRTTFRQFTALHASAPGNRGHTPGNRGDFRGHQSGAQRIRQRLGGAVQTTFRQFTALHASLPVNHGCQLGNRLSRSLASSAYDTVPRALDCTFDYWRCELQSRMAALGVHDTILRRGVLVEGAVISRQPYSNFTMQLLRELVEGHITSVSQRMTWFEAQAMGQAVNQCSQAYQQAARGEWEKAEASLLEGVQLLTPLSQWAPDLATQVEQRRRDVSGLLLADEADREGLMGPALRTLQSVGCHAGKT
jgi:hypothetical protein